MSAAEGWGALLGHMGSAWKARTGPLTPGEGTPIPLTDQNAWGPQQLPEGAGFLTSLPDLPALGGLQTSEDPNPAEPEPTAAVAGVRDHLRIEARNPQSLSGQAAGPAC